MKLELKHLAPYLPHELKIQWGTRVVKMNTGQGSSTHWIGISSVLKWYNSIMIEKPKPVLIPISALTEPLEDGSVPAIELIKIQIERNSSNYDLSEVCDLEFQNSVDWSCGLDHYILPCIWWKMNGYGHEIVLGEMCPRWVSEYLFANHFDIFGLIPEGLAVDKRTIS